MSTQSNKEIAIFGGGCFWCTEAIFSRVRGVRAITSGYAWDHSDPIEVIRIEFDPTMISYSQLLDIFWHVHDPTSRDRQGADTGAKYRSIIFTVNNQQYDLALTSKMTLQHSREYQKPIVTQIQPLEEFQTAEAYHQQFFEKYPDQPYCTLVIAPKLKKFLEKYSNFVK